MVVSIFNVKKDAKESEKLRKMKKAGKALDEDKDDLVLCAIPEQSKPVQEKTKKVLFAVNVKPPTPHKS